MKLLGVCAVVGAALLLQGCGMFGSKPEPGFAGPGAPEGGAEPPKRVSEAAALKRFDVDGDGNVTKDELEKTLIADFKKDDVNGDAKLDAAEARALNESLRKERNMSPVFDWNADGEIVYSEFATQWRTLFERADRNRDGIVDADELEGQRERKPRPAPPIDRPGRDVGRGS